MNKLERPEELFAGRHFDREVILLCVRWYFSVQAESAGPGGDDRRARPVVGSYHHHAVGAALYTGVREALAPACTYHWPVMACRRDIDPWCVALPISCHGSGGSDTRLQIERPA